MWQFVHPVLHTLRIFGAVVAIALLAINFITPAASQGQAPPVVNGPRIPKIGDTGTIRRNNNEIVTGSYIGKEGELNCWSLKSSVGEATNCNTPEGNFVRAIGSLRPGSASPHNGFFSFPLFVGKSWDHRYTYTFSNLAGGQVWTRDRRATVTSYEKITVPAGTFDTFKIESSTSGHSGNYSGVALETYYYSPETGGIVKYDSTDFNTHTELLSYTRAK
ncbi:MAG: hypothetical protein WA459_23025 [Stellaceae bacterium]